MHGALRRRAEAVLAYLAWLALSPPRPSWRALACLGALALAAPLAWSLSDAVLTGDPLWSLTGTQEAASQLRRATGLDDAILLAPRRIGEIVREPVLLGAVAGAVLAGTTFGQIGRAHV